MILILSHMFSQFILTPTAVINKIENICTKINTNVHVQTFKLYGHVINTMIALVINIDNGYLTILRLSFKW